MASSRARILLAEDHAVVAEGLKLLIEKSHNVIGIVANGRALVTEATKIQPDLIVLDIGMPLLNGMDAARRIRERLPKVKIVFLTMQENPNLAAAAMQLGSVGFVIKHSAGSELLRAIDQVLSGRNYLTPKLKSDDWVVMKRRQAQFGKEMTDRQREILQLCAEGRSIKEVAWLLNLSVKTVEFHKYHIMELFELKNIADLVLFALEQGLITRDSVHMQPRSSQGVGTGAKGVQVFSRASS